MITKKKGMSVLLSLLLAVAFSLVFYAFNTPLGPSIGSDNAIYLTMGTALENGYAPYTEIFDHKGPLVFLLQWLPQAIGGGYSTIVVFIQEVVFLFLCLRLIDAIAGFLNAPSEAVQLVYLALTCSLVGGGNLTEEYTNLFTLAGLYAAFRVFGGEKPLGSEDGRGLFMPALAIGAATMLCFLTRANNALPLCALIAMLAGCLLACGRFAALGRCAIGFTGGCVLIALPVALWLAANGALGASYYGAIVHNMMYASTDGASRISMMLHTGYGHMALLMAFASCAGALALYKARRTWPLSLAMAASAAGAGLAAFISHKFYDHYLMLGAPLATCGVAALLPLLSKGRVRRGAFAALMLVCCAWLGVKGKETNDWRLAEREGMDTFTHQAQTLYAQVPEGERDRFMAYRVEPKWYVAAGALPCMRFYFLQEILADADPRVMDEIVDTFETDPPRWLVIYYNRAFSPPYDPRVAEIFETRYAFVDSQGEYQLLRLVGEDRP